MKIMYYQENMCCLCLTALEDSKNDLFTKGARKMTYFSKLSASLMRIAKVVDTKYNHSLCKKCCESIDSVYNFHESSLRSIKAFSSYKKLLGASKSQEMCIKIKIERNIEDFLASDEFGNDFQVEYLDDIKTEDVSVKNETPEPPEYFLVLDDSDFVGENSTDNDVEEFLMKTENLDDFSSEVEKSYNLLPETIFLEEKEIFSSEVPKIKRRYRYFCEKCPEVFFSKYDYLRHEMSHSCDLNEPNFSRQEEKSSTNASSIITNLLECSESQNYIPFEKKATEMTIKTQERQNVRPLRLSEKLEKLKATEILYERTLTENVGPISLEKSSRSKNDVKKSIVTNSEDRPYKCGDCQKSFRTKQILLNHLKVHQKREFYCLFCKNFYRDNSSFITHSCPKQNEILKGGIKILKNTKNQPEKIENPSEPIKLEGTKLEMDQPDPKISNENIENQIDSLKKWKCKFCPKSFPTTYYLRKHQNQHEKNYKCSDCPATFLFETNLKIHHKMRHKVEARFEEKYQNGFANQEKVSRISQDMFKNDPGDTDLVVVPQKLIPEKEEPQIGTTIALVDLTDLNRPESTIEVSGCQSISEGFCSILKDPLSSISTSEVPQGLQPTSKESQSSSKGPQLPLEASESPFTLKRPKSTIESPSKTSSFPEDQKNSNKIIETVKFMVVSPQNFSEDPLEGIQMKTEGLDIENPNQSLKVQKTNADVEPLQFGDAHCRKPTVAFSEEAIEGVKNVSEFQNIQLLTADQQIVTIDIDTYNNLLKRQKMQSELTCDICFKVFSNRSNLNIHKKLHSATRDQKCKFCSAAFKVKNNLKRHLQRRHKNLISTSGSSFIEGESPKDDLNSATTLQNVAKLNVIKQELDSEKFMCDVCGKTYQSVTGLKCHLKSHGPRRHECSICHKKFFLKQYLTVHMETHYGETKFICELCGKSFVTRCLLYCHKKSFHSTARPYECFICKNKYKTKNGLQHHMRVAHEGRKESKSHQCKICNKTYSNLYSLRDHLRSHENEKNYKCDICGKEFIWSQSFSRHRQWHKRIEAEKLGVENLPIFTCKICCRDFKFASNLQKHMRLHKKKSDPKVPLRRTRVKTLKKRSSEFPVEAVATSRNEHGENENIHI